MDWLAALQLLREEGRPGVLATVLTVRGHAPRESGAKMVVGVDGTWGSVGGGNLEASVVERGREVIVEGLTAPEQMSFGLNEHADNAHGTQCCGGDVTVLLEPFVARPSIAVFGLGHVGLELGRILARLPVSLHLVDSRAEMVDAERLADVVGSATVHRHHAPAPEVVLRGLPAGSHVMIMSHDHSEDLFLCDAAITRGDLGSVGLIGSRAKWLRFRKRLGEAGHDAAAIESIHSPIGSPGISGKTPEVIAISVAASLVQVLEGGEIARGWGSGTVVPREWTTTDVDGTSPMPTAVEGR
ncbi:xanthine dehydrogenase accessory protein XdhC [Georgenia sp. Z1491]|uniref:xanthine dehydrogenase accessory protein XdhC n=1 Tax=Georgenia sp. Z1491 TaxID=3416707 RepID=UPI003CFB5D80